MQDKLLHEAQYGGINQSIKDSFAELRIHAEELARNRIQRNGIEDVTLDEIYDYLGMRGDITEKDKILLKELEIKTEYDLSYGIRKNIEVVKGLVAKEKNVVLISDMYLPSHAIKDMLLKADAIFENIPLYVSNDYRKIKLSGNLYRIVAEKEGVSFDGWQHFGDNPRGDVIGAKKVGISVKKYEFPSLSVAERYLLQTHRMDKNVQLIVGTSRNARLELCKKNTEFSIGTYLGAFLLVPYVEWIVQECLKKDIRRLYFIARDGFILKKIADIIIKARDLYIETFYIYGSRKAWRMPSFSEDNHDVKELLNWSHFNKLKTLAELSDVFQISESELRDFLPTLHKDDVYLDALNRKAIEDALCDEKFYRFLIHKHENRRNLAIRYLKENIDVGDDRFALVELAGSGYTQLCLAHMMKSIYPGRIKSFYFKMDILHENAICDFYTFFPSRLKQHILIEVLCHAPHGQTSGYSDGEIVQPEIERYEDNAIKDHGIEAYIAGIEAFVNERYCVESDNRPEIRLDVIRTLYDYLNDNPDKEVLSFIADMPNSVTGREKSVVAYAPVLSDEDIHRIFLGDRTKRDSYYRGTSLECSVMRCTKKQHRLIDWCNRNYNSEVGKEYRCNMSQNSDSCHNAIPQILIDKRIVVYAAGHRGQAIYDLLSSKKDANELLWVDVNWKEKQEKGLPVRPVCDISNWKYDLVIITIENREIAESVKETLIEMRVLPEKIIFF